MANAKTTKAAELTPEAKALAPLRLVAPGEDYEHWSLCLYDSESPLDVFEEAGRSGNGYAWDSVARIFAQELPPAQSASIDYNSEGGMFVAESVDREALVALGLRLSDSLRDLAKLRAAIAAVPEEDWDD